jgi:pimeloyl-ACP methyl ester carboxylesterase
MKLSAGGRNIHYETQGAGPALLLLHAFPLSSALWAGQAEAFASRNTVVRVDARGFGGSDLGDGPLTMDQIAEDAAAVLDHLGLREAVVAGLSMGGYAALAFARRFPGRLRALALCDTKAVPDGDEARAGRFKLAEKVQAEGPEAAAAAMVPKLLGSTSHRDKPELVARVRALILEAPAAAIVNALHGLAARADSRPTLGAIAAPTLVLRGEEDAVASADEAREMHEGIRGSRLVTVPRAGHLPNLEAPADFDAALGELLAAAR